MIQDFRFAFRQLWKTPGFTIAAIAVLALGIGANSAVFSLVHTILFASPGYARPAEVLKIYSQDKTNPNSFRAFSYPNFLDIRQDRTAFNDVLAYQMVKIGIGDKGDTRRAIGNVVSSNFFSVLGVAPVLGRAFLPEEETPGRGTRVAVVSYNYWKKHGGNPAILGSQITLNGRPFTVVGVAPEGFTGTMHLFGTEVWLPLGAREDAMKAFEAADRTAFGDRAGRHLMLVGRLKPGVTKKAAEAVLKGIAMNLEQAFPVEQRDQTFIAGPLPRFSTSNTPYGEIQVFSALAALLFGMSAVVLLVASLNLANMLLARGTARRKEIAIRLALGAGRGRIVRQLLTEGLVLAVLGGAAGIILALWSSDLLVASLGQILPIDLIWFGGPNPMLVAATLVFSVIGTVCFSLGPALKLSRAALLDDLKEHAGEDVVVRRWKFLPRNPLVVVQFAVSLALVTAAALFIRGAGKAVNIDTGLKMERTFLVEVDASLGGYGRARAQELYRTVEEKLSALPGVESASISATMPFGMFSAGRRVQRAGFQPPPDAKPAPAADGLADDAGWSRWASVGANYFKTAGLPLLRGRIFTTAEATQSGGPAVAITDETLAKKLWPEGDALGQRLQIARENGPKAEEDGRSGASAAEAKGDIAPGDSLEVIGIVPHTPDAFTDTESVNWIYVPFSRSFQSDIYFLVKFSPLPRGGEADAAALLRRTIASVDSALPILSIQTFEQLLEGHLQLWLIKAGAAVFSVFGALALGLAVVGLYGVKAYSVARRTREIGIRMALGAQPATVQRMILREGSVMLATGLVLGLLLALVTGQIVGSLLYQVSSLDPLAFTVAPMVLTLAGLIATWLPARRATKIDPMTALRTE
ncbi:MAG TPA: ABC transporter permease [Chthoniobacterales bacterium]|nr:ABC transporter permease [Chthoniobacterales bacterium]